MSDLSTVVGSNELTSEATATSYSASTTKYNYTIDATTNDYTHSYSKDIYTTLLQQIAYEAVVELDEYTGDFVSMSIVISNWILANGIWNDDGEWIDVETWNDS